MTRKHILSNERERQLVEQIQRGDRGALGELLGACQKRIYHLCLRMVSNAEDAADLTQETMLKAVNHIDSFRQGAKFTTWLTRIAINLCISHLRKRKLRIAVSLDAEVADGDQAAALKQIIADQREPSAERRVQQGEQVEMLTGAIDKLEPMLRSVILLRDLQGMDYQQMAEVLEVPLGTVKSRLFRARLALRQALDGTLKHEADHG